MPYTKIPEWCTQHIPGDRLFIDDHNKMIRDNMSDIWEKEERND